LKDVLRGINNEMVGGYKDQVRWKMFSGLRKLNHDKSKTDKEHTFIIAMVYSVNIETKMNYLFQVTFY